MRLRWPKTSKMRRWGKKVLKSVTCTGRNQIRALKGVTKKATPVKFLQKFKHLKQTTRAVTSPPTSNDPKIITNTPQMRHTCMIDVTRGDNSPKSWHRIGPCLKSSIESSSLTRSLINNQSPKLHVPRFLHLHHSLSFTHSLYQCSRSSPSITDAPAFDRRLLRQPCLPSDSSSPSQPFPSSSWPFPPHLIFCQIPLQPRKHPLQVASFPRNSLPEGGYMPSPSRNRTNLTKLISPTFFNSPNPPHIISRDCSAKSITREMSTLFISTKKSIRISSTKSNPQSFRTTRTLPRMSSS